MTRKQLQLFAMPGHREIRALVLNRLTGFESRQAVREARRQKQNAKKEKRA